MLSWQRGKTRIFLKTVALVMAHVFFVTSTVYPAPSIKSLFKNKRPNHKAIQKQRESALEKKRNVLSGRKQTKKAPYKPALANRIKLSSLKDLSSIYIPETLGRVIEVYEHSENNKLVVHIQDLHTNPEAQLNLAGILELLIKDYKLGLVCSEGAEGKVDTSSVSSFPDKEVREKTARLFINSGELTGEEYLSITKYPDLPIWGIEDKDIYFQNIIKFNKIMKFSPNAQVFIHQAKEALKALKPKIYSKDLMEIDAKETEYEEGKIDMTEYLDYLIDLEHSVKLNDFKNIALLQESLKFEKEIDQKRIIQESQDLLANLQAVLLQKDNEKEIRVLLEKATLFKDQKIAPFSFYSYLNELARRHLKDDLNKYPNLTRFVEYLEKINLLDSAKLFQEIEAFAYKIKGSLSTNQNQKLLTKSIKHITFLEDLFNLKVSNEELDYYLNNKEGFKVGWFKSTLTTLAGHPSSASSVNYIDFNPDLVDKNLSELEHFYEIAHKRDIKMVANTINEIEKRKVKVAALISGGFHTRGITELLKGKGYSYVVISPYSSEDIDEENYRFLLSGNRKPLSELIEQLNEKLRLIMGFSHGRFKASFNDLIERGAREGWLDAGDISPIDINILTDRFMALEVALSLLLRLERGLKMDERRINHMFVKRFREGIREDESIELKRIGGEWYVSYGDVKLVVKDGRIETVENVPIAGIELAFNVTQWGQERDSLIAKRDSRQLLEKQVKAKTVAVAPVGKSDAKSQYPAQVERVGREEETPDIEGKVLIAGDKTEGYTIKFDDDIESTLGREEKDILRHSLMNWIATLEHAPPEEIPIFVSYDLDQIAEHKPGIIEVNRALLRAPPQDLAGRAKLGIRHTPEEHQLFVDGVIWHEGYHLLNPAHSETKAQQATLEYFETRPDIRQASINVLDEENQNLIHGLEWLEKLHESETREVASRFDAYSWGTGLIWGMDEAFEDLWDISNQFAFQLGNLKKRYLKYEYMSLLPQEKELFEILGELYVEITWREPSHDKVNEIIGRIIAISKREDAQALELRNNLQQLYLEYSHVALGFNTGKRHEDIARELKNRMGEIVGDLMEVTPEAVANHPFWGRAISFMVEHYLPVEDPQYNNKPIQNLYLALQETVNVAFTEHHYAEDGEYEDTYSDIKSTSRENALCVLGYFRQSIEEVYHKGKPVSIPEGTEVLASIRDLIKQKRQDSEEAYERYIHAHNKDKETMNPVISQLVKERNERLGVFGLFGRRRFIKGLFILRAEVETIELLTIAGNIMDFSDQKYIDKYEEAGEAGLENQILEDILSVFKEGLNSPNNLNNLLAEIVRGKWTLQSTRVSKILRFSKFSNEDRPSLVVLNDNAGEDILDLLRLKLYLRHGFNVTMVGRDIPVLNDATWYELDWLLKTLVSPSHAKDTDDMIEIQRNIVEAQISLGIENPTAKSELSELRASLSIFGDIRERCEAISSGSRLYSTPPTQMTNECKEKISNATMVIAKGQGNLEGLWPVRWKIPFYHILMLKYASRLGVRLAFFGDRSRLILFTPPSNVEETREAEENLRALSGDLRPLNSDNDIVVLIRDAMIKHGIGIVGSSNIFIQIGLFVPEKVLRKGDRLEIETTVQQSVERIFGSGVHIGPNETQLRLMAESGVGEREWFIILGGSNETYIENGAYIGPNSIIVNSHIGINSVINSSMLIYAKTEDNSVISRLVNKRGILSRGLKFEDYAASIDHSDIPPLSSRKEFLRQLQAKGIVIIAPWLIYIHPSIKIEQFGNDIVLLPGLVIDQTIDDITQIGSRCVLGYGTRIIDTTLEPNAEVMYSSLDGCYVASGINIILENLRHEQLLAFDHAVQQLEMQSEDMQELPYRIICDDEGNNVAASFRMYRWRILPRDISQLDYYRLSEPRDDYSLKLRKELVHQVKKRAEALARSKERPIEEKKGKNITRSIDQIFSIKELPQSLRESFVFDILAEGVAISPMQRDKERYNKAFFCESTNVSVGVAQYSFFRDELFRIKDRKVRLICAFKLAALGNYFGRFGGDRAGIFRNFIELVMRDGLEQALENPITRECFSETLEELNQFVEDLLRAQDISDKKKRVLLSVNDSGWEAATHMILTEVLVDSGFLVTIVANDRPIGHDLDVRDVEDIFGYVEDLKISSVQQDIVKEQSLTLEDVIANNDSESWEIFLQLRDGDNVLAQTEDIIIGPNQEHAFQLTWTPKKNRYENLQLVVCRVTDTKANEKIREIYGRERLVSSRLYQYKGREVSIISNGSRTRGVDPSDVSEPLHELILTENPEEEVVAWVLTGGTNLSNIFPVEQFIRMPLLYLANTGGRARSILGQLVDPKEEKALIWYHPSEQGSVNITKGENVSHTIVNMAIRKGTMEKIYGNIPQVKVFDEEKDYIILDDEAQNIDAALSIIEARGPPGLADFIKEHLNIIAITPVSSVSFLLTFHDRSHLQAIHAGLTRHAVYLPKGLYKRIKSNPMLLASAVAHDAYEVKRWFEAYEKAKKQGFRGNISKFRDINSSLAKEIHSEAQRIEETIAGTSTVVEGSLLDEEIAGFIDEYYQIASYTKPSKEAEELIGIIFKDHKAILETYLSEMLGVGVTINRIREINYVGEGALKTVYRVALDTNKGFYALGIRLIKADDIRNEAMAKREVSLFNSFYSLDPTIVLHIRKYYSLTGLEKQAPEEHKANLRHLRGELGIVGVTFGEFMHGFTLDKIPSEEKVQVYRENVELLLKGWFTTWDRRNDLKEGKGYCIGDLKPTNFIYSYRFDRVFFVDLDQADRYTFKQFMSNLLMYLGDSYPQKTGLNLIDMTGGKPKVNQENIDNIRDILVQGFLNVIGEEQTRELFEYFMRSTKPTSPHGLIVSTALRELDRLTADSKRPYPAQFERVGREEETPDVNVKVSIKGDSETGYTIELSDYDDPDADELRALGIEEQDILRHSLMNWIATLEHAPPEEIPIFVSYDLDQVAEHKPGIIEINRALLRAPPEEVIERVALGIKHTPEEHQLFVDGVIWHEGFHFLNPAHSETKAQQATLEYFGTRPDIGKATRAVLDEDNQNLIHGLEWLEKIGPHGLTVASTHLPKKLAGQEKYHIVTVCQSNVFRSPILAYRLSNLIKQMGYDDLFSVDSRGMSLKLMLDADHFDSLRKSIRASLEEVEELQATRIPYTLTSKHQPELLDGQDVNKASLILVANSEIRDTILKQYPQARGRVFLISEFLSRSDLLYGERIPDFGEHIPDLGQIKAKGLWDIYERLLGEFEGPLAKAYESQSKTASLKDRVSVEGDKGNVTLHLRNGRAIEVGNVQGQNFIFGQKVIRWAYDQGILDLTVDRWRTPQNKAKHLYEYVGKTNENVERDIANRKRSLRAGMRRGKTPYVTGMKEVEARIEGWCKRNAVRLPRGWAENKKKKKEQRVKYLVAQVNSWFAIALHEDDTRLTYRLFDEQLDISGLPFWNLPIFPITESGEIDTNLVEWMIEGTKPPQAYLDARKISLEDLLIRSFVRSESDVERKELSHALKVFSEKRLIPFREYFGLTSTASGNIGEIDHITIAVNDGIEDIALRFGIKVQEEAEQGVLVVRTDFGIEIVQPIKDHPGSQDIVRFSEKQQKDFVIHSITLKTKEINTTLASLNNIVPSTLIIDKEPRENSMGDKIAFIHPRATKSKMLVELIEHVGDVDTRGPKQLQFPGKLFTITLAALLLSACSPDPTFVPMLLKDISVVIGALLLLVGAGAASFAYLAIRDKTVNIASVGVATIGTIVTLISIAILLVNYPLSHFAEPSTTSEQPVWVTDTPIPSATPAPTITPMAQQEEFSLSMYEEIVVNDKQSLIDVILATNKASGVRRFYINTTWIQPNPGDVPTTVLIEPVDRDTIANMLANMPDSGLDIRVTLEQGPYDQFIRISGGAAHFSLRSKSNSLTKQGTPTTERFSVAGKEYDVDEMQAIESELKEIGVITPEHPSINVTFTIRGPTERKQLLNFLQENPQILIDALNRSQALHEGNLSQNITIVLADR
ncbi:ARMT1-like domain-containing protein, partial [Candidatus Omnitrophota bacterium]